MTRDEFATTFAPSDWTLAVSFSRALDTMIAEAVAAERERAEKAEGERDQIQLVANVHKSGMELVGSLYRAAEERAERAESALREKIGTQR